MQQEFQEITLGNIGQGAGEEMFQEELKKVISNIQDPNTVAEATREINLKIRMKPNLERDGFASEISVSSKVVPISPSSQYVHLSRANGRLSAFQQTRKQSDLFKDTEIKEVK